MPLVESGFIEIEQLGEGAFGTTFLVKDTRRRYTSPLVVIKVPKFGMEGDLKKELNAFIKLGLKHENLVSVLGITEFKTSIDLVLEFINGGNLTEKVKSWSKAFRDGREEEMHEAETALMQILRGVKFIHDNKMVHRDIKPSNILYSMDSSGKIHIKVADLGLARICAIDDQMTVAGTLCYMAPEILDGKGTFTVDIYSVGVIIYQVITGKLPVDLSRCQDTNEAKEMIKKQIPKHPEEIMGRKSGLLSQIAMQCVEKDPEKRYKSIDDILKILGPEGVSNDRANAPVIPEQRAIGSFEEVLRNFIESCKSKGISLLGQKKIEYGMQLTFEKDLMRSTVNIYAGKKGVKIVLGGKPSELLNILIEINKTFVGEPENVLVKKSEEAQDAFPPPPWIGTDESGKGDYFGPLVIAGVYVGIEEEKLLLAAGVRDSKMLDDEKVLKIADRILKICKPEACSVVEISPETYNKLYAQFKAEGKNLNTLLAWGHARAIENIVKMIDCETVISDQFGDESYIKSKLLKETRLKKLDIIQVPKAERNIAVAAASILARAKFLNWLITAEKEWGVVFPKGASPAVEQAARQFVAKFGRDALSKVVKLHFKTTERI